jgi:hypothetical protein
MSTLVAEIAKEAHTVVVDERDIRANDGFAVGQLDDFDQNFLGSKRDPDNEECRSYKDWPQVHT